jgi:D-alanine-D-alanine ligase
MSATDKKVAVLYGRIAAGAPADEEDVLVQAKETAAALVQLGYAPFETQVSLDLQSFTASLAREKPAFAFNLVETLGGSGRLAHVPLAIMDALGVPYTGAGCDAVYLTTNKLLGKRILRSQDIRTPDWQELDGFFSRGLQVRPPLILKPVFEDASVGLTDLSLCRSEAELRSRANAIPEERRHEYLIERFIEGREFNISLLQISDGGPEALPAAEIEFRDFPEGKPRMVNYDAKWSPGSFEFRNTVRTFEFGPDDTDLLGLLRDISVRCWNIFGLRGYARVDFRVDTECTPWVLEINANPCISPDSGFVAAARRAGCVNFPDLVQRIIHNVA